MTPPIWAQKKRWRIGIDLGHAQVRLVAMRPVGKGLEFAEARQVPVVNDHLAQALRQVAMGLPVKQAEVRIILNASRREELWNAIALCEQEGFLPRAMVSTAEAMESLVSHVEAGQEAAVASVDVGHTNAELVIVHQGKVLFQRPLPVSGTQMTQSMVGTYTTEQGVISLQPDEAERLKQAHGFPFDDPTGMAEGRVSKTHLMAMIRPQVELLAGELFRLFQFFHHEPERPPISRILLSGSGTALKGLDRFLAQHLGLDVARLDPFQVLHWAHPPQLTEADRLGFAPVIGAVLKDQIVDNLLPLEYQERAKIFVKRLGQRAIAVGVLTALCLGLLGLHVYAGMLQSSLGGMQTELTALQADLSEARQRMILAKELARVPHLGDLFKELSHLVPSAGVLSRLQVQQDEVILSGEVNGSAPQVKAILTTFVNQLEAGILEGVALAQVRQLDEGRSEFTIRGRIE